MPTKVSLGLSKKTGLPDYGSVGASCHVELELDGQVLDGDQERFRQHVRRAYSACQSAVEEELSRARSDSAQARPPARDNPNGARLHDGQGNGQRESARTNGQRPSNGRTATQSQLRAIRAIASRQRLDLGPLLDRFGVRAADDLSIRQASELIDQLKAQSVGAGGGR